MKTSDETDKIDAAIVAFHEALEPVEKNKGVDTSKDGDGRGFKFRFATFAAMLSAVQPLLVAHGIALYQGGRCTAGAWSVVTRISHAGQWVEAEYPVKLVGREGAQGFGGGISFAKRWGIRDLLEIEVPDDAEEAQGYTDARRETRAAKSKAPPGIALVLETIRGTGLDDFARFAAVAGRARAAHPTGEASVAVEQGIAAWLIEACGAAKTVEHLEAIGRLQNEVKGRGNVIREAMRAAEKRLGMP